jgi:hypothetical protein
LEHRPSAHKAHVIALIGGIFFLAVVVALALAVIVDPDGGITGIAPFVLTLPWSLLAAGIISGSWPSVLSPAAILFGVLVNAALVYLTVRGLVKVAGVRTAFVILAPISLGFGVALWFLNLVGVDGRVRIVNGGQKNGIWLATDQDGLRAMAGANGIESDVPPELRSYATDRASSASRDGKARGRREIQMRDGR